MGLATLGWISGCIVIWSSLFTIGKFLYGQTTAACELLALFIASGLVLIYVTNRIWSKSTADALAATAAERRETTPA
jgi:hypothetical protein